MGLRRELTNLGANLETMLLDLDESSGSLHNKMGSGKKVNHLIDLPQVHFRYHTDPGPLTNELRRRLWTTIDTDVTKSINLHDGSDISIIQDYAGRNAALSSYCQHASTSRQYMVDHLRKSKRLYLRSRASEHIEKFDSASTNESWFDHVKLYWWVVWSLSEYGGFLSSAMNMALRTLCTSLRNSVKVIALLRLPAFVLPLTILHAGTVSATSPEAGGQVVYASQGTSQGLMPSIESFRLVYNELLLVIEPDPHSCNSQLTLASCSSAQPREAPNPNLNQISSSWVASYAPPLSRSVPTMPDKIVTSRVSSLVVPLSP